MPDEIDVLIAGGGMAGLCTAVAAQQAGARVLVAERGGQPGGSLLLAPGMVWAPDSFATIRELIPRGDPGLQRTLVEGIVSGWQWLESLGIRLEAGVDSRPGRQTRALRPPAFVAAMLGQIQRAGGKVLTETILAGVERTEPGWTASLESASGVRQAVRCRALVLATGGFQNSPDLVRQYLGIDPEVVWERNSGLSDGTGLRVGRTLGADLAGAMETFYGHCMPAPPARFPREDFVNVTQYYGPWAVALNLEGRRYCDEGASDFEETLAQDTARQPRGWAFYVFDQEIYQEYVANAPTPGFPPGNPRPDRLQVALDAGGPVCRAETLADLTTGMERWGVPGPAAAATLAEFDEAARAGRAGSLAVPKRRLAAPLAQPPFFAVGVKPGLTFTMGGLRTDTRARVLDEDGAPIAGLYAAGADAGNLSNRHYAGGLSAALVFGRIAGDQAGRTPAGP